MFYSKSAVASREKVDPSPSRTGAVLWDLLQPQIFEGIKMYIHSCFMIRIGRPDDGLLVKIQGQSSGGMVI
jgi:hypothetical protein